MTGSEVKSDQGKQSLVEALEKYRALRQEFNPFIVLKNAGGEDTTSRMISWLLDAQGSHGCGDQFARAWLPGGAGIHFNESMVIREMRTDGGQRADIVVEHQEARLVWVVELKTYSHEHSHQLCEYRAWCDRESKYIGWEKYFLFVTRYGDLPAEECEHDHWISRSFENLTRAIDDLRVDAPAPRLFVKSYVDAMRRWFLIGSSPSHQLGMTILNLLPSFPHDFRLELRDKFPDEFDGLNRLLTNLGEQERRVGLMHGSPPRLPVQQSLDGEGG